MADAVLVTGGREFDDLDVIVDGLRRFLPGTLLIHGDARGADTLCGVVGRTLRFGVIIVPYFNFLGRAGGPARNTAMLRILQGLAMQGYNTHVIAFHHDLDNSRGTLNMVTQARRAGYEVEVWPKAS